MSKRLDGRSPESLRPVRIIPDYISHPEGSVLIEWGDTKVLCSASVEDKVPHFRRGSGGGWVTSEYGMLPRSTGTRMIRESSKGRPSGRTQEIQRLIGRALRSVVDLDSLGERTFWIDCDVIQADGGTRTASITGAFVALAIAMEEIVRLGVIEKPPLLDYVAAVSVGILDGEPLLDLNYSEDSNAQVDMNLVMTGQGDFVEVQGTAEGVPFSRVELDRLVDFAEGGIDRLIHLQRKVLVQKFGEDLVSFRELNRANPPGDIEPR